MSVKINRLFRVSITKDKMSRRVPMLSSASSPSTPSALPVISGDLPIGMTEEEFLELAALQATVDDLGQNLRGHIRLSVPVALGQQVVGPLLLEFAALYPEVSLQLTFSNRIFDLVAAEIDVAIRVTSTPPDTLVARDLGPVDWALCASPAYLQQHGTPQQPDDLLQLDMVSVNL